MRQALSLRSDRKFPLKSFLCFIIVIGGLTGLVAANVIPKINPSDIMYTPCGHQLIRVEPVQIGGAQCLQLSYADGSMNHLCESHPQS